MRTVQILIKTFALCLAGVIIVTIVASVIGAVSLVGVLTGADENTPGEMSTVWQGEGGMVNRVTDLDVNVGATTVYIYESQDDKTVRIETNNEHINSWQDGNTLHVVEKSHLYLSSLFSDGDLVVYVPVGMKFDEVEINAGAGTLKIEKMVTNKLDLKLGAGKTSIDELEVKEEARIDGGAGLTEIKNGDLNNLDLELGAGKAEVKAKLSGNNKIHSGAGKLELDLIGREADYKLMLDKGIGSVKVNGESQKDDTIYGQGKNLVEIESGVGAVEINMIAK